MRLDTALDWITDELRQQADDDQPTDHDHDPEGCSMCSTLSAAREIIGLAERLHQRDINGTPHPKPPPKPPKPEVG